jgi:predicted porin
MKKTVLAVTLAALPLAAMADVTLYGKVKMGVETSLVKEGTLIGFDKKNEPVFAGSDVTRTNIDDLGSRIGFKGTEALSSNLNAIWQIETALTMTGSRDGAGVAGGSSFGKLRDSFVGLQSNDFGTLQLGRLSNFANEHQGVLDVWTAQQTTLSLKEFTNNGRRYDHAVRYTTPDLSGFTGFVQYGQEEAQPGNIVTTTDVVDQANRLVNVGLKFKQGPWLLTYGYQDNTVEAVTDVIDHSVEGVYQADGLLVGLGYRNNNLSFGGLTSLETTYDQYALTVAYEVGAWKPKFSYAYGEQTSNFEGEDLGTSSYDQAIIGVDYSLSKRTVIGTQFGYLDSDSLGEVLQSLGVNVVHSF